MLLCVTAIYAKIFALAVSIRLNELNGQINVNEAVKLWLCVLSGRVVDQITEF
jgi:hypothetical protein